MLGKLTSQDMTMITVEIADPFSSESQRLIETL
ncbi:MAG TPA: GNAT family N-acetyltransferase, partial [Leclercia adecarboxylata]|nr:GNAT family N-acetyltransferase [Leclercia adecarboxylata]